MTPLVREDSERLAAKKPERNKSEIYPYKYNGNLYEWLYFC